VHPSDGVAVEPDVARPGLEARPWAVAADRPAAPLDSGDARDRVAGLRAAARPLLGLALGLIAAQLYLYAAALAALREASIGLPIPLFIPQAVVLAALLLTRPRYWWLLLLESYALRIVEGTWLAELPLWYIALSNVANVLEPLIGALLLRRFVSLPPRFAGLREVCVYALCVVTAAALGATWGTASRLAAGGEFWSSWLGWFLGDGLASLLLAPAIVLWVGALSGGRPILARPRVPEAAVLCVGLLATGFGVFNTSVQGPETAPALLYLPVPLLLWAAVRFGPLGLTSALALVTSFAVAGVANGLGPFVERSPEANLFTLQLFLVGIGVPLLVLAALVRERQQAQAGLERSEARYRAVVSNFPRGAVLLFGADLRHLFADGEGLPEIGLTGDAVEGKTPWEVFPAGLAVALVPRYRAALAGAHASFDLVHAGRTYQIHVLPVSDVGAVAGLAVLQDVTEQRRAAELAEVDRARTAFLGNVSHELRTPLTLLLGPLQEVLAAPPPRLGPAERKHLEIAHRNGLRLLRLVNSLLDFSRLGAGQFQPTYVSTDLSALTTELASVFRSAIEHAGLRLAVDCQSLPQPVYVDREQWEHVVFNLLANALKFTFEGEIEVTLRERDGQAVLAVRDTGAGIAAEELPHLFERFHRVREARARTHEGTGIGLALVRELARLHGGTVDVASAVGVGSTFTVALPFGVAHLPADRIATSAEPPRPSSATAYVEEAWRWLPTTPRAVVGAPVDLDAPAAHAPASADRPPGVDRPARLLIVEDNADMRTYLQRLLEGRGTAEAVGDGVEALEVARSWEPDLIVADVMMPGLDGLELLRAVRADPRLSPISVILLSARAGDEARVEALRAGADDYLVKPFVAAELLARVESQLGLAQLRGEAWAAAERRRLARELHDSVTQALFAASMTADVLPALWELDPDEAREALTELRRLTGGALAEMRTLLLELRPDALVRAPLHEVLQTFITAAAVKTTAIVETWLEPAPALPPDVQLALYRIAQEAFTNSARHGRATRIAVRLSAGPATTGDPASALSETAGALTLEVTDDGQGFDPARTPQGRLGLGSIRERADSVGATLRLSSRPGGGTTVAVTWRPSVAGAHEPPALAVAESRSAGSLAQSRPAPRRATRARSPRPIPPASEEREGTGERA
jgi:signal transduction histidine kinase